MSLSPSAVALQGLLGLPIAIALQGFSIAAAAAEEVGRASGGGRRRPRPNPYAELAPPAEPDAMAARRHRIRVQALVIAEAL